MHIVEFCQFIEERSKFSQLFSKSEDLSDLRVLKGPDPDTYLIAVKLTSIKAARNFVQEFHRRKFNQIESDLCIVYEL